MKIHGFARFLQHAHSTFTVGSSEKDHGTYAHGQSILAAVSPLGSMP